MRKNFDHRNGALLCTILFKNFFFILLLLHLTGCGFQGRKYTTGHYWNGRNHIEYEKQKENGKKNELVKTQVLLIDSNAILNTNHEALASIDDKATIPITPSNWREPSKELRSIEQPIFRVDTLTTSAKEKIANEIPSEIIKDYQWFTWTFFVKYTSIIIGALISTLSQYNILWNIPTFIFLSIGFIAMILNFIFSVRTQKKIKPYIQEKDNPKWVKHFKIMKGINLSLALLALGIVLLFYLTFLAIVIIIVAVSR